MKGMYWALHIKSSEKKCIKFDRKCGTIYYHFHAMNPLAICFHYGLEENGRKKNHRHGNWKKKKCTFDLIDDFLDLNYCHHNPSFFHILKRADW